jgi:hypothetical protein
VVTPLSTPHPRVLRVLRIAKKPIIAALLASLFIILGLINNIGYHVAALEELSYIPHLEENYATVVLRTDITFNPLLYPAYWIQGTGHISGDLSFIHVPALTHTTAQGRVDTYLMFLVTAGNVSNFLGVWLLAIIIEFVGKREIYIIFFSGIIGFTIAGTTGTIAGILVGMFPVLLVALKSKQGEILSRFWSSLWE